MNRSIISSYVEFANASLIERFSFIKRFFDLGKNMSPGIVSMFCSARSFLAIEIESNLEL